MPIGSLNSAAQAIVDAFETAAGGPSTPASQAIVTAITSSPSLLSWFNSAATSGEITAINYNSSLQRIGNYDPSTSSFNFSAGFINDTLARGTGPTDPIVLDDFAFAIGHESEHADSHGQLAMFDSNWATQVSTFDGNLSSAADATSLVQSYVAAHVGDEAAANIQGWNDEVSLAGSIGQALSALHNNIYIYDTSTDQLRPGLAQNADGTISPTPANIAGEAAYEGLVHPSIGGSDNGVTYNQFYAAAALNNIEAGTSGHAIDLDFHALGLDQPSTIDDPSIFLDQGLVDQRLIEGGFQPSGTNLDVVNSYDMSTSRFSSSGNGYVVNVFGSGDPFANTHEVLTSTGAAQEVDRFNGPDGSQYERDITSFNADGTVQSVAHAYFVPGDNAELLQIDNAQGEEQWAAFWDSTGTLSEYDDLSSGHLVSRYFMSDGSQAVDVFNNDMTAIVETATFGSGASFASEITKTDASGVTTDEVFDSAGLISSISRYDQAGTTSQADMFVSGQLSREELMNPQAGISDETWTFDPASGQLTGFSETGAQAQSWAKQSDGRWLDLLHNTYSSTQPTSIPTAPATPEVFDASDLLLPSNWAPPTPIHTVDPFHF